MAKLSESLKLKLKTIINDDYEECRFVVAAAQLLTNKIHEIAEMEDADFNHLRDSIGEIGVLISNAEKRLQEVEDCYTKLIETLAEEKPDEDVKPDV